MARYYLPQLHTRVRYRDIIGLLQAKKWLADAETFHANVCDCAECKETLNGDAANFVKFGRGNIREVRRRGGIVRIEYPTGETKLRCLRHYLQRKALEYRFADTASEERIRADLKTGRDELINVTGLDGVSHLNDWLNVLS
jgi:ribosomal protein L25 (general stress protein Ctc)